MSKDNSTVRRVTACGKPMAAAMVTLLLHIAVQFLYFTSTLSFNLRRRVPEFW